MSTTLDNLTTFSALAERCGICERTLRYWSVVDMRGFRRECTVKVGGRRLMNLPATAEWLKRVDQADAPAPEVA